MRAHPTSLPLACRFSYLLEEITTGTATETVVIITNDINSDKFYPHFLPSSQCRIPTLPSLDVSAPTHTRTPRVLGSTYISPSLPLLPPPPPPPPPPPQRYIYIPHNGILVVSPLPSPPIDL